MQNMRSSAIVYFLNKDAPREFPSLRALAFVSTCCPAQAADTAWIEVNGERVETSAVRSLAPD